MAERRVEFLPHVVDFIKKLGERDRAIVGDNVAAVRDDPRAAGHPSGLKRARQLACQHLCRSRWAVLYRWQGCDPAHPYGVVTVEDLVEVYF
jgi:mRNA-degrading endonuclease RelE of RelBE toxin-antitoxin system